jgi:hypothetical protein
MDKSVVGSVGRGEDKHRLRTRCLNAFPSATTNFLSEGVRLGLEVKKSLPACPPQKKILSEWC